VVSKAASLRARSPLRCARADDPKRLTNGGGPTRVGVGLLSGDGSAYRLLREMGGTRQLLRVRRKYQEVREVSEDQLEIDSFLRVEAACPPPMRTPGSSCSRSTRCLVARQGGRRRQRGLRRQPRVKALKDELEMTKKFERRRMPDSRWRSACTISSCWRKSSSRRKPDLAAVRES